MGAERSDILLPKLSREEILAEERALYQKIQSVELFPGTLEELEDKNHCYYQKLKGPLPGGFVGGTTVDMHWKELAQELAGDHIREFKFGPFFYRWMPPEFRTCREICVQTARLDGDAVVEFTPEYHWVIYNASASAPLAIPVYEDRGIPVKTIEAAKPQ